MNPDWGIDMWNRGFRGKIYATWKMVSVADYGDARELSGHGTVDLGDGDQRYCMTVRTKQSEKQCLRIATERDGWVAVVGRLDTKEVVGDSGERYRMVIGRIERALPGFIEMGEMP
jgi:hypothetical protein